MHHFTAHYLGEWENEHLVCQGKLQARECTITSPARPAQWANPQSSSRLNVATAGGSPQQLTLSETLLNNAWEVVRVPRVN